MAWPEPSGPVRKTTLPIRERTGSTASITAPSPPAMIASEPSTARLTPPETGASMRRMAAAASSAPRARVPTGSDEAHVDDDRARREVWAHRRDDRGDGLSVREH